MVRAEIINSMEETSKDEWDQVVGDSYLLSYDYLLHVERTMKQGYKYIYIKIYEDEALALIAPLFSMNIGLDTLIESRSLKKVFNGVRHVFKNAFYIKTLVVGSPPSAGNFGIKMTRTCSEAVILMAHSLKKIIRSENLSMILYKEISGEFMDKYSQALENEGFNFGYDMPNNYLYINWDTDEEYLASMRRKYRQAIAKSEKKLNKQEIRTELIWDIDREYGKREYDMYYSVLMKSSNIFETLSKEYFSMISMAKRIEPCMSVIKKNGRLIGYVLLCKSGQHEVSALFAGIDYEENHRHDVYFNLYHQITKYAISNGMKRICFGQNTYEVKQRMGCETEEMYIGFYHRNLCLNKILAVLSKALLPQVIIEKKNVFK